MLVAGDYDYDAPAPWLALAEDPTADRVSAVEIEVALLPYLNLIAQRTTPSSKDLATRSVVVGPS